MSAEHEAGHDAMQSAGGTPLLKAVSPRLPVREIARSLGFYVEGLGFAIGWQWGTPPSHASVFRDALSFDLIRVPAGREGTAMLYVEVTEVDALHAQFAGRAITCGAPVDRDYGMRDFEVVDPDGNRIAFGQSLHG